MNQLVLKTITLLNKKEENKNSYSDVVGTEIRLKRSELNYTLKSLTSEICSISYLSKIENSKIDANVLVLKELCDKLDITDEQLGEIVSSADSAKLMVKAYYQDDTDLLKRLYDSVSNLKNYRAIITKSFYLLKIDDLKAVEYNISSIKKAIEVLNDLDALLFSIMFSIYLYKKDDFVGCYKIIRNISFYEDNYYTLIITELLTKLLFKINDDSFIEKLVKFRDLNWKLNEVNKLSEIKTIEERYRLRRKFIVYIESYFNDKINYEVKLTNLIKKMMDIKPNSVVYKMTYIYLTNKDNYVEQYTKSDLYYECTEESLLLEYFYLSLTNHDKAITHLLDKCIPYAFDKYNYLYSVIFTDLLKDNYIESTRYKRYFELESNLINHFNELSSYFED